MSIRKPKEGLDAIIEELMKLNTNIDTITCHLGYLSTINENLEALTKVIREMQDK